jgi:hypothetical protein
MVVVLLLVALNTLVVVVRGTYWLIRKKLALLLVQTNKMFFRQ